MKLREKDLKKGEFLREMAPKVYKDLDTALAGVLQRSDLLEESFRD